MKSILLCPEHPIAFDQVAADDVVPSISTLIGRANSEIESLVGETAPATWENTLGALERLTEPVEISTSIVEH